MRANNPDLAICIACFGLVWSCAWTLLNRGSKFWQESWETKVERFEIDVTGKLFAEEEAIQYHKGCWLRARKFSVSKLVIALSDYVFFLWFALVASETIRKYYPNHAATLKTFGPGAFVGFSFFYALLLIVCGRKSLRPLISNAKRKTVTPRSHERH